MSVWVVVMRDYTFGVSRLFRVYIVRPFGGSVRQNTGSDFKLSMEEE
jgi:hypothetical protein